MCDHRAPRWLSWRTWESVQHPSCAASDGQLHQLPTGQIRAIENLSQKDWSRLNFTIEVSADEDLRAVRWS